jgi:hypothetical protein
MNKFRKPILYFIKFFIDEISRPPESFFFVKYKKILTSACGIPLFTPYSNSNFFFICFQNKTNELIHIIAFIQNDQSEFIHVVTFTKTKISPC